MIGRAGPVADLTRATGLNAATFASPAPLVIVYGGASTGKSMAVSQALRTHPSTHTLVDCTALYSAKDLYREAVAQLHEGATMDNGHGDDELVIAMETFPPPRGDGGKEADETVSSAALQDEEHVRSLNFLSFFKTLDKFMTPSAATTKGRAAGATTTRRILYFALDHVDRLLDRGLGALLTCVCTMNDQIAYLHVRWTVPALGFWDDVDGVVGGCC